MRGALTRLHERARRFSGTPLRGLGWAVVAAIASGATWYLVVRITASQSLYFGLGMGALIGYAASIGSDARGLRPAGIAAAVGAVAVVICLYYVNRFTFMRNELRLGRDLDIPVLPGFGWFRFVISKGLDAVIYQYLYLVGCPALAGFMAWRGVDSLPADQG